MAKKTVEKLEPIIYMNDANAMKAMIEEMAENPKKHRPPQLRDFLDPLWPSIDKAMKAGVPAGAIAKSLRDSKQLDVSDAAFRKFVNEKQEAAGWEVGSPSLKAGDAAAKAAAGKPKA